jgi:signal transduction histidine kinase
MKPNETWLDRLAHDLRGPLTPLQTAAYLLSNDNCDPAQQRELFALIDRQTRTLAGMIDEISDWARLDRGMDVTHTQACEVGMLLDDAIAGLAAARSPAPRIDASAAGASVEGDPRRLVQMICTLMAYAMSRNPSAAPDIGALAEADAKDGAEQVGGRLRIEVLDRGPTLDTDELATLFAEPMPEPYDGGLGLKLLIAQAIAQAHGGSLRAEARNAGGLRLCCELPCVMAAR